MKFSKQLMYNAVAEWREHYLDYSELKKYISRLGSVRQQLRKYGAGDPATSCSPLREATLAIWIRGDVPRGRSASHSTASLSSPPPEEIEVDALHAKAAARFAPFLSSEAHGATAGVTAPSCVEARMPDASPDDGSGTMSWMREGDQRSLPPRFSPSIRTKTTCSSASQSESCDQAKRPVDGVDSSTANDTLEPRARSLEEALLAIPSVRTGSAELVESRTTLAEAIKPERIHQPEALVRTQDDDDDDDDDDSDSDDDRSDHAGQVALSIEATPAAVQSQPAQECPENEYHVDDAHERSLRSSAAHTHGDASTGVRKSRHPLLLQPRSTVIDASTVRRESGTAAGAPRHGPSGTIRAAHTAVIDEHRIVRNTRLAPALRKTASSNVLYELEHGTPRHSPGDYFATPSKMPADQAANAKASTRGQRQAQATSASAGTTASDQKREQSAQRGLHQTSAAPSVLANEQTPLIAETRASVLSNQRGVMAATGYPSGETEDRYLRHASVSGNLANAAAAATSFLARPSLSPVTLPWAGVQPVASFLPNEEWAQSHREAFWRIERRFFERLHIEAAKVDAFFQAMHRELERISRALVVDARASVDQRDQTRLALIRQRYRDHYVEIVELVNYVELNATGFEKILKKHDKVTGLQTKATFQRQVLQLLAFYRAAQEIKQADTGASPD
ncbi:hypothetical protein CCYA_CCYA05G1681 [Cyanidiococcus yangmingshanensis]|nr:hypothetical protein CCYA_CCYA05G1681 [Cyanidiococcus yangmingshanensis]